MIRGSRRVLAIVIVLSLSIPVSIYPATNLLLGKSESMEMAEPSLENQSGEILKIVEHGMEIIRGDKPFLQNDPGLGSLSFQEPRYELPGTIYHYSNKKIPSASLTITTVDDPLDVSVDRDKVALVPLLFEIRFYNLVDGINPDAFKDKLNLAGYWVAAQGIRYDGNDLGAGFPPDKLMHRYRYRAEETAGSKFGIDVEISYYDPPKDAQPGTRSKLSEIDISRDYPPANREVPK
ncbi:hypothetical protein B0G62_102241 [Paraburkholderia eburnea]|uniref:Uncharacterized protein n=2 Tax=Paraburkholderia eburnea TaxID=1189126 RepID=A0A2S4MIR1_9BURK|nr:hypothetical protein B0G62_102241 [Paraburkholderia eburnea]PRZ24767.1 hypothetical protein BX588_103488 [Paraburkholderia eburnea]